MSGLLEESARVSLARGGIPPPPPPQLRAAEAVSAKAAEAPSAEIVLSPEAKAALQTLSVAREKG